MRKKLLFRYKVGLPWVERDRHRTSSKDIRGASRELSRSRWTTLWAQAFRAVKPSKAASGVWACSDEVDAPEPQRTGAPQAAKAVPKACRSIELC